MKGDLPVRRRLGSYVVILAVCLVFPASVTAQESVPTEELRGAFFSTLNKNQVVEFMRAIDRSRQLTSYELGAKYRWGYIPPDRTPPASLARWWKALSPRKRDQKRVKWFREHSQQLDPDQVAQQLGLQDRLTSIYRKLRGNYSKTPEALESVPFPEVNVVPTRANTGATEFEAVYEQEGQSGASTNPQSQTKEPTGRKTGSSAKEQTDEESSDQQTDDTAEPTSGEMKETDSASSKETSKQKSKPQEFASGDFLYRRVGDHIEVIGRTERDNPDEAKDQTVPADLKPSSDGSSEPDTSVTSTAPVLSGNRPDTVSIPLPLLRHRNSTGETAETPRLRRPR